MHSVDGRRAAQYVRMSTDMQRYSIENQTDAIARYAAQRGLSIVRSYEDAGRSGLKIEGRLALTTLIDDVQTGRANFQVILVYDVSRWGRFQDSDESAYYEYICKAAGLTVEYCAEQFENDGSLTATILKNIKRAMAGEYSRELSTKVHAGQRRIAAMGFHTGAAAGYGLRRVLLDEQGNRKQELALGQRKSLKTERVILVPGPAHEVETVRHIYDLFIDQKKTMTGIAEALNQQGILNVMKRPWGVMAVRQLLISEKYCGCAVYNRGSKKLGARWKRNPSSEWVRTPGAFEAIISKERYDAAQKQIQENKKHYNEDELLDSLRTILRKKKYLSRRVLDATKTAPSHHPFNQHFGNLTNAFRRVGYTNKVIEGREESLALRRSVCAEITTNVLERGGSAKDLSKNQCRLLLNEELTVAVVLGRTSPVNVARNHNQWRFCYYYSALKADILVVARIDVGSSVVRDYLILPTLFLPPGRLISVSGRNYQNLEGFRATSLVPFYDLCARKQLQVRQM
jgi:DNA invertase Pin-like site-specific DNA recombinase